MQYDLDPKLLPPSGASVQCTRCSFVFTATPSGEVLVSGQPQGPQGGASRHAEPSRTSSSNTTRIFGSPAVAPPQAPERRSAATTTLVFGATASSGSPPTPSPSRTQVFGAPQVPRSSAATTTQVFGAVSVPSPAPSPSTTQVFGSASIPASLPKPATTQAFGASEIAEKATVSAPPPRQPQETPVPWMVEPGPPAPAPRGLTGESRPVAPPAPSVDLPVEPPVEPPVALPPPALPALPPEPAVERSAAMSAPRQAPPIDLPPEMFVSGRVRSKAPAPEQDSGGGKERLLIALVALVVIGVTGWLTYPAFLNRGSELPSEAVSAKDQAVVLLRRDDDASRKEAIESLRSLVARYPKYTEAQAELVVALAFQLDDVKVELEWIGKQEEQLRKAIERLQLAKTPADWQNRVNARKEELAALALQRQPLDSASAELEKQLEEALVVIRAAPETEPAADVVARVKAQAIHAGVNARPEALAFSERLRKVENPPHWSAVARAEFGLNANSQPAALEELAQSMAEVREQDRFFVRAYLLGARLALRQRDPATAKALLEEAVVFTPSHTLARKLQQWADTLEEPTATPTP
jgi:hypothetical protein